MARVGSLLPICDPRVLRYASANIGVLEGFGGVACYLDNMGSWDHSIGNY